MNMVEFYRKMDGLLNPSTTSKKVVDESAITVIQPSSSSSSTYTPVRPNADSAAVSYANRNADAEYEEYVYVEITDDENRVYQGAVNAGMEEVIANNRGELNKQITTIVDQYMEYICDLDYEADGIPLDANKISRILNLLTGCTNEFTKEYVENNKDKSAFIMADVTKEYIKFAEKKINEYAAQMQVSEQNIASLKDADSNNLSDLKEIFSAITENGYATQHETATAREATTDYIIASMLNGSTDTTILSVLDPRYSTNVNYTNAQKYAKEAERYEKIGDYINAEKSYGKAYDAIAKMVAKVPITDLAAAVSYASDDTAAGDTEEVEDETTVTPPVNSKPNNSQNTVTETQKNQYEQIIAELSDRVVQLENIIKTFFEALTGVTDSDKTDNTEKTEETDEADKETTPTMNNIMQNMEDLKNLPASMSDFVTEMGYIYNKLVSADTVEEAEAAFEEAKALYTQIQDRLSQAKARLQKLKVIKERAEALAASEGATDTDKQIAASAVSAYTAAEDMVKSLTQTLTTAEQMVKDTSNVLGEMKNPSDVTVPDESVDTVPSTPAAPVTDETTDTVPSVPATDETDDKTPDTPAVSEEDSDTEASDDTSSKPADEDANDEEKDANETPPSRGSGSYGHPEPPETGAGGRRPVRFTYITRMY